jgi:hypothetical protein
MEIFKIKIMSTKKWIISSMETIPQTEGLLDVVVVLIGEGQLLLL